LLPHDQRLPAGKSKCQISIALEQIFITTHLERDLFEQELSAKENGHIHRFQPYEIFEYELSGNYILRLTLFKHLFLRKDK
jgi:hypothetical protein